MNFAPALPELFAARGFEISRDESVLAPDDRKTVFVRGYKTVSGKKKIMVAFYFYAKSELKAARASFAPPSPLMAARVRQAIEFAQAQAPGTSHICILQQNPTVAAATVEYVARLNSTLASDGSRVSVFTESMMQFNLLRHKHVPRCWLSTRMAQGLVREQNLPLIRFDDPVAEWLGAELGQIVVEERVTLTRGVHLYFRLVTL